jgi:hypothetical protein
VNVHGGLPQMTVFLLVQHLQPLPALNSRNNESTGNQSKLLFCFDFVAKQPFTSFETTMLPLHRDAVSADHALAYLPYGAERAVMFHPFTSTFGFLPASAAAS